MLLASFFINYGIMYFFMIKKSSNETNTSKWPIRYAGEVNVVNIDKA